MFQHVFERAPAEGVPKYSYALHKHTHTHTLDALRTSPTTNP